MNALPSAVRRVRALDGALLEALADVLIDCVDGGASVSFMHPLSRERALAFWRKVASAVETGQRALLVAEDAGGPCGTVQLVLDQPENQPYRADLSKLLVHWRARRGGIGAVLMRAAETTAREHEKTLLVLDAVTGGDAARLYERLRWCASAIFRVMRCCREAGCAAPPCIIASSVRAPLAAEPAGPPAPGFFFGAPMISSVEQSLCCLPPPNGGSISHGAHFHPRHRAHAERHPIEHGLGPCVAAGRLAQGRLVVSR